MSKLIRPEMALRDQQELNGMLVREESEGSLNSGLDLEGPQLYDFPVNPEDYPEFVIDTDPIVALEHRLTDLLYLKLDIEKTHGMSQSFALEAEKLIPGFGGGDPIGYYSKEPSATRLKVSLEELENGIWALIGAAITAALMIIYKLYRYFAGDSSSPNSAADGGSSSGDTSASFGGGPKQDDIKRTAEKAIERVDEQIERVAEEEKSLSGASEIVSDADQLLLHANLTLINEHGHEYTVRSLQDVINNVFTNEERYSRAKNFLNTRDPMLHDVIHNGEYSQMCVEIGQKLEAANAAINMKLEAIETVMGKDKRNPTSTSNEMENTHTLSKISKPVEITVKGQTRTLQQIADLMSNERAQISKKPVNQPVSFDRLFTAMANSYRARSLEHILTQLRNSLHTSQQLQETMYKLRAEVGRIHTDGVPGSNTNGVAEDIRNTISEISKEIIGHSSLCAEIRHYVRHLEDLSERALGFAEDVVHRCTQAMHKNNQTVPEGWKEVYQKIKDLHLSLIRKKKKLF